MRNVHGQHRAWALEQTGAKEPLCGRPPEKLSRSVESRVRATREATVEREPFILP